MAGYRHREARAVARPAIRVRPRGQQPPRIERAAPLGIEAAPQEPALVVLQPVRAIEDPTN